MNTKNQHINLGDICIDVIRKDIKNVHLSVHPPTGRVRISAPSRINLDSLRVFAISKLSWIKKHKNKYLNQKREAPREYISRESHYFLGKRHLLKVIEHDAPPKVEVRHERMEMYVRPNTGLDKRREILEEWYRQQLKEIVPHMISHYEELMKVSVNEFGIKKMKTKWGTCSIGAKRIWLNLELAKKQRHYIQYIIAHEMTHLLERKHNERFVSCLNKFVPQWKACKEELNHSVLGPTSWNH